MCIRQCKENPASFLAPSDNPCVRKDPHVPRDPRLALAKELREFADGKLHVREQRQNAYPGRVGKRLKQLGEREGFHGLG